MGADAAGDRPEGRHGRVESARVGAAHRQDPPRRATAGDVATTIIGARDEAQLRQNLGAVGWSLTCEQIAALDTASETTKAYPYWHQAGFAERNPPPV